MSGWTVRDSSELYGIGHWGSPYFAIGDEGQVQVHPHGEGGPAVDLHGLVQDIRRRGLRTPLLIRFSEILSSRVRELAGCFERAIQDYAYQGRYRGVYPVKVNQQRRVVEELVEFGRPYGLGLEVGSKPELLIALAHLDTPEAPIICNGYKDRGYIETALLAQRLGRYPIIVLDRPNELDRIIKISTELGIRPHIGVRAKLSSRGTGRWADSSGSRSKFGLSASEIVATVERLRADDMLDCLELLHFHIGSQITAIRSHKEALGEASRILVGLHELGARVRIFDVGGGLGVDYDGSQTSLHSSMNYNTQEYAHDVVAAVQEACNERGIPHPEIVTEAGRALVAHHSVLVFDVLGVDRVNRLVGPPARREADHRVISELHEVHAQISRENALESYHDAVQLQEESASLFKLGYLDLAGRARTEEIFWSCCRSILHAIRGMDYVPEDLQGLERALADTYYGNFSVFQSLPDTWAVRHLFPIMPIHRLDECPTERAILADLTCDSDGKVDQFIDRADVRNFIELHEPGDRPYYIGVFLVGAYQETLGDLHNLFGDTDTVHVHVDPDGRYRIDHVVEGDTVEDVLSYVQYDRRVLVERVRQAVEAALLDGRITLEDSALLRRRYEQALSGNTYLDQNE
ncbi:MAG: biosynthetic arginine decarboxylase [Myxococcota bacterium]|nr:biosynthetic arginine decarboxylase [Myxococcota bacterium]